MIPKDYVERVYAGVLGKLIGVYLGRPFEGWTYEQISTNLGEITSYVHEKLGKPLIVTDDDLTGTFTFLRALADNDTSLHLTPAQIGQTWLNYIIPNRTILWWGGVGHSTEHTAFMRLKSGIPAPRSGSSELNGRIIAEQIGAQIFIDGWGMVAPGDPELAVDLARRAASVSHDGEAIYGAQVVAAMISQAFVEEDLGRLIDTAVSLIPQDCTVYRLIADIRNWHVQESDWRKARQKLADHYGYDQFGGNCHIIPNHGLIMLSLLYGEDNFRRSLMIVNTCGWDTDCNSGNVGCLLGVKHGLAGIETVADLRYPLDDRLYLPTADGGRAITDAVRETYMIANAGRALKNLPPLTPKDGAYYHFSLPGSVQAFRAHDQTVVVHNTLHNNKRFLALSYQLQPDQAGYVGTDTFIPQDAKDMPGYELLASPTLYPGQTVHARILADAANHKKVQVGLFLRCYGANDELILFDGPGEVIQPDQTLDIQWEIPPFGSEPIAEIGIWMQSEEAVKGTLFLDSLTWEGEPMVVWNSRVQNSKMWSRSWVNGVDHYFTDFPEMFRLAQDSGRGLLIQGTRDWRNITLQAAFTPYLAKRFGLATHVQGMQRYYALLLEDSGRLELVRVFNGETVLAAAQISWDRERVVKLSLQIVDNELRGWVDDLCLITAADHENKLVSGGIALVIEEGCVCTHSVVVKPAYIE